MEIERKFLVKGVPDLYRAECKHIEQVYLEIGEREVRIRKTNKGCFLTIKKGKGLEREEKEKSISLAEYNMLLESKPIVGHAIKKKRYVLPIGKGLNAELDIYEGALDGLRTVEVEFTSKKQALSFHPPEWFGEDVTEDSRFKNASLAVKGMPALDGAVAQGPKLKK